MTTLFPQIKRVDEDETSKIIKNVLIDDQDELKLEHIFDEFMHLTEESITFSDDEDEDDDDDEEDEDDDDDEDNGEEEEEDDSDDDDDEEDEEDDDDDSSSGSDESDSSESDEEKKPEPQPEPSHRQPTSWNLDQFIKTIPVTTLPATTITTTITNTTIPVTTLPATTTTTILTTTTTNSTTTTDTKTIAPIISQQHTTTNTTAPTTNNTSHPKATKTPSPIPAAPTLAPTPSPKSASVTVPVPAGTTATITTNNHNHNHNHNNHNLNNANNSAITPAQQQPSGSLMIEIDLSKLKRIPTTKVPTPNTTSNSMMTAKALKHEADAEKDKTKQAIKYLESAMYFVLHGYELEDSRYYQDTVPLFKHVLRSSMPGSSEHQDNMTNLKIHTLTLKCLSLIHMKMYKLREREVNENYKVIYSPQNKSPVPHADPSLIGIRPTLLSAFKRQLQILSYLRCANDYWQQADHFCDQHPAVRIFFSTIDSNCGNLTMSSPLSHLMDHFKCGLKLLRS